MKMVNVNPQEIDEELVIDVFLDKAEMTGAFIQPQNVLTLVKRIQKSGVSIANEWKIPDLVGFLKTADQAYYNDGDVLTPAVKKAFQSIVTDKIYDELFDILKERSPNNQYLKKVGAPVQKSTSAPTSHASQRMTKLPFPMASLDKLKPDTFDKWVKTIKDDIIISNKVDGVSLGVVCDGKGEIKLYSRGNGETGQDVSYLLPHIKSMKTLLKHKNTKFMIRGELVIPASKFKNFASEYKNPRNLMSGIMSKSKEISPIFKDVLFVGYSVIEPKINPKSAVTFLKNLGIATPDFKIVKDPTAEKLTKILIDRKKSSSYDMDGLVISLASEYEAPKHSNPKNSRAYKDPALVENATAEVIKVDWKIAKSGIIAPLVCIEPTELSGVTVSKITGHNAEYIKNNKIGPGAIVSFSRRGEVIPCVEEVLKKAPKAQLPEDIAFKWDGVHIVVDKENMDESTAKNLSIKQIKHFFRTLGVENLSDKIFERLYNNGFDDIFKLIKITKNDLLKIPGFQEKSAERAYKEIHEATTNISIVDAMRGSSCFNRLIGTSRLEQIVEEVPDFLKLKPEILMSKLVSLNTFSDTTAGAFVEGLQSFKTFLAKLKKVAKVNEDTKTIVNVPQQSQKLSGMTFVFTGFRDKELSKLIKENGGSEGSSVNAKTSVLVLKDMSSSSSKSQKADQLGIKKMGIEEFKKYITKKLK